MIEQTLSLNSPNERRPCIFLRGKLFKTVLIDKNEIYMTERIDPNNKSRTPKKPITVLQCYGNQFFILDGNHRFAEIAEKQQRIKCQIIHEDNVDKISASNINTMTLFYKLNRDVTKWRKEVISQRCKVAGKMSPGKILQ
jgi:hypothetical protein